LQHVQEYVIIVLIIVATEKEWEIPLFILAINRFVQNDEHAGMKMSLDRKEGGI